MDFIIIKGLEISAHIGVSEDERRNSQRLLVDVVLTPLTALLVVADDISNTVDYHAVARRVSKHCRFTTPPASGNARSGNR